MDPNTDVEELYNSFKNMTNDVTKETVGLRKRKSVERLSMEEAELCSQRRKARSSMLNNPSTQNCETYRNLNKQVKAAVRKVKAQQLQDKVITLEEQFRKNDSYSLFKTVKELEGKPKKSMSVIKDDENVKHFQTDEIVELWKDHFKTHLNTSFPRDENVLITLENLQIEPDTNNSDITEEEIQNAIKKMKNKKAPGFDSITIEAIKAGGVKMVDALHKIFNTIWKIEKTPMDFSRMVVTPIHKKGDVLIRKNYRAIALLSIPGKIFLRVLMERMKEKVTSKLSESQYGFRPGRGTVDAIFILRQIIEKAKEKNIPIHFHFIDFKAAFDTIWRNALWKMLEGIGVNPKIINIIKYIYENTQCAVMIDGNLTDWFSVLVGVRQGCILSPMLFNIFLEFIMDELKSLNEFRLKNDMAADIRYADDTTLVSAIFSKLKLSNQELEIASMK